MNRIITLLIICLLLPLIKVYSKGIEGDSLTREREITRYLLPTIGGGLVVAGSLLDFDHGGRTQGMDFKHSFNCKADEVLRFVPAAALVGMKAFGIESRTEKWSELIVRSAASTAIMGLTVESTKRLAGRVRPDGSDDRSFPSGHTAAAFLTASLFAKEYGHQSPWYSVGAYGVATSTAMLRRINDKHWMSDVMVGAGIGILSVELGYALADIFYKRPSQRSSDTYPKPFVSSAGVYMNYVFPRAISGRHGDYHIRSRFGYSTGMEASYFFHQNIGIGGSMGITSSQIEVQSDNGQHSTANSPLDHVFITVGPHFIHFLSARCYIGALVHGGYGFYPPAELATSHPANLSIPHSSGWGYKGGILLGYLTRNDVSLHLTTTYQSWSAPMPAIEHKGLAISLSAGWNW